VKAYAIIIAIGIAIGAAIGGGAAWRIQGVRIGHLQANVETLTTQLSACQGANAENIKTIDGLQIEVANANGICDSRLKTKEGLVKRLQEIDNLKPRASKNEAGNPTDAADPLLGELNGMFTGAADRIN
jgi:hypothetical protein